MGEDDEFTVDTITAYRKTIVERIESHHGRVVDAPGDNILAGFSGALNAAKWFGVTKTATVVIALIALVGDALIWC